MSAGDIHAYDHIDLPPIQPVVTLVLRHRGRCPCCRGPSARRHPRTWRLPALWFRASWRS
ncbi:hypothetical protein [Lichenifustis flavocetrariae]|uniref:hypothetical protein n=1 Tax=Lichenifustis flavocetrariae TaxID=2949735 RepID=UPI003D0E2C52